MSRIGFDLDMTLIDSRPGIGATLRAVAAESGHAIDVDLATSRLGPPLSWELAHWMPQSEVETWVDRYRELYPEIAIDRVEMLPGARDALDQTRTQGEAMVISAKYTPNVQRHLDHLDVHVDAVFGNAWREQKADVLIEQRATMYVGDHEHDMVAARLAGVIGIGVSTGGSTAQDLVDHGADLVLPSLLEFDRALALLA